MITLRSVIFFIVFLNLLGIGLIMLYTSGRSRATQETSSPSLRASKTTRLGAKDVYQFTDPILAFNILRQLDTYEPVPANYSETFSLGSTHLGLKRDAHYCEKSLAYFIDHPEALFKQKNFFADYLPKSLSRGKVIRVIGQDVMPDVGYHLPKKIRVSRSFDLKPNINAIFTNGGMHRYQLLGKEFACNHQLYNHVIGVISLNSKTHVALNYQRYQDKYLDKPQCLEDFFPKTYILTNITQCYQFFEFINTQAYAEQKAREKIVFVKKIGYGAHKGKGVMPLDEEQEQKLREQYENGAKCGVADNNYQMQRYIPNPLLLDGHKFDFRIYMLIASTNPLILYYHDGFLRLSLHKYDPSSKEKGVHLTNTDISKKLWAEAKKEGGWNGMNETELRNFQMWNFTKFHNYLMEHNIVNDKDWLENNLRYQVKRSMAHIGRLTQHRFLKRSNTYELFGIDFLLDDDLKLWFIECNSGPVLKGTSEEKERFLVKMLSDHFNIMFDYMRSRMKRIINFVNQMIVELPLENIYPDQVVIFSLDEKKKEFRKISMNYLEPEFQPEADNGFVKVIDENLSGKDRYAGLIPEECI